MEADPRSQRAQITRYAGLAALTLLLIGSVVVLRPFIAAGLFAAVFVLATWPAFTWTRARVGQRNGLAAGIVTLLVVLLVILPFVLLTQTAAERVPEWFALARGWFVDGLPPPPAWIAKLPFGATIADYWSGLAADPGALQALGRRLIEVGREPLVEAGRVIGEGILQMLLASFIGFFFYRDGESLMVQVRAGLTRLAGSLSDELIATVAGTVRGVVLGIVGTALAQGAVATVGFLIAGVPGPFLLGGLTALVSLIPGGTALVWLGATIWLLAQEQLGWALFMTIWGIGLISSIDNVVRPILISRGASLSFVLVFVGVIGGILAFGFVGIFIGPTLLALVWRLWRTWLEHERTHPSTATGETHGTGSAAE
jgi:predicted PurR-regulated permease PerM